MLLTYEDLVDHGPDLDLCDDLEGLDVERLDPSRLLHRDPHGPTGMHKAQHAAFARGVVLALHLETCLQTNPRSNWKTGLGLILGRWLTSSSRASESMILMTFLTMHQMRFPMGTILVTGESFVPTGSTLAPALSHIPSAKRRTCHFHIFELKNCCFFRKLTRTSGVDHDVSVAERSVDTVIEIPGKK